MKIPDSAIFYIDPKNGPWGLPCFRIGFPGTDIMFFAWSYHFVSNRFKHHVLFYSNGFFKGEFASENVKLTGTPFDNKLRVNQLWDGNISVSEIEMIYEYMVKTYGQGEIARAESSSGGICQCKGCGVYDEYASPSPNHNGEIRCYRHY